MSQRFLKRFLKKHNIKALKETCGVTVISVRNVTGNPCSNLDEAVGIL